MLYFTVNDSRSLFVVSFEIKTKREVWFFKFLLDLFFTIGKVASINRQLDNLFAFREIADTKC